MLSIWDSPRHEDLYLSGTRQGSKFFMMRGRRRGFTLIEALAAGVILASSAAVISLSVSQNMAGLVRSQEYQIAADLLDTTLTRIDFLGPAAISVDGPTEGEFNPPYERYTWVAKITSLTESDLYRVGVTVCWPRADGTLGKAEAETLLYDPPDSHPQGLSWDDF